MTCKTYPLNSLKTYKYVVVLSEYNGKMLLSRHRMRNTWETQGGHIEAGETPMEAARRELFEESGASKFEITPLCDYWAGIEGTDDWANGMVFRAVIHELGDMPQSEMAEVRCFDRLPDNLTYPAITPVLFGYSPVVTIRRVRPGDEDALAYIQTTSWKSAFRHIVKPELLEEVTQMERAKQMYRSLIEAQKGNGYILELNGIPHCIAYWDHSRTEEMNGAAELICIHSLPDNWHKGYGSLMMNRILSDIRAAGFRTVFLWVFKENKNAICFYRKHGFHANGKSQTAFGAMEVMYERRIDR